MTVRLFCQMVFQFKLINAMSEKNKKNLETKVVEEEKKEKKSKFTEKELSVMAQDYFKRLKCNTLYGVEDGQFFFKNSDAQIHARKLKLKISPHNRK